MLPLHSQFALQTNTSTEKLDTEERKNTDKDKVHSSSSSYISIAAEKEYKLISPTYSGRSL